MEKKKYYPDVNPNPNFPELEEKTLKFWETDNIFQKSIDARDDKNPFIFYDGPPFANGLPHYGHLLTGYVKDVFARYQTMLGRKVERRFGWDCHGLPAEMGAEKELGISGRAAIQKFGIDKFNDKCRADVMKYAGEWEKYVHRQARWVDFQNDYKTMDKSFMESVMWAFKQLYDKGLIYEAMRVMPYSWAAETPLSNFETRLDNSYRERADKAVTVAFELEDGRKILAWTTTPWTLPSNLALAVKPEMEYIIVTPSNDGVRHSYIIAKSALDKYSKDWGIDEGQTPQQVRGDSLVGLTYKPLFPYFANQPNAFKIISGDFIEEGSGTGIVHIAPGFGEDDYRVAQENNIGLVVPVDSAGRFTDEIYDLSPPLEGEPELQRNSGGGKPTPVNTPHQTGDAGLTPPQGGSFRLQGRNVFDTNDDIIKYLKTTGAWIKTEQYLHNYPHCWRTDQPLIYRAMPSWYVEVTKFKDRMVELNQGINWIPDHVKDGLMGKWLEGARDWSISRNRFWGAPIPIWRSKSGKLHCVGSIAELEKLSGQKVTDLHRPYIDEVKFTINGEEYTRVEDVLDCWFESGSMPFASQGYPYTTAHPAPDAGSLRGDPGSSPGRAATPPDFPADFIVEYTAQTRGWFYTMMVLSTALFDKAPFKNCICHGVVLDAQGQKLSKRLNNYPDPLDLFKEYGSDALRWAMLSSPIMRGQELYIDKEGKFIRDVVRLYIKPIWNAYNFFTLYANSDGIKAIGNRQSAIGNLMDQYILAKCDEAVAAIKKSMDEFDTPNAYSAVEKFFEVLNNWYIRRSKDRFWKTEHDADKQAAYDTLYTVLTTMCCAAAPLLPLTCEEIYKTLTGEESVHLTEFPESSFTLSSSGLTRGSGVTNSATASDLDPRVKPEDDRLVLDMDKVRDICNAALSIRSAQNIRVRQPLSKLTVVGADLKNYADIIADELNVKKVEFANDIAAHAEYKLKINFPILGKRLPEKMKQIIPAAKSGAWSMEHGALVICGEKLLTEEFELLLEPKSKTNSAPLSTNDALVVLDLNLTTDLINEGLARDIVRMVQQARKDADLNVADRINLSIETKANIVDFKEYIKEQTLAAQLEIGAAKGTHLFENELDGEKIKIALSVA